MTKEMLKYCRDCEHIVSRYGNIAYCRSKKKMMQIIEPVDYSCFEGGNDE